MKRAYFDCFAGASGDMILGAFADAGLDMDALARELGKLRLPGYELVTATVQKNGLRATQVRVETKPDHAERRLDDIVSLIGESGLPEEIRRDAVSLFRRLATVEARIHGTTVEQVHFHELGGVDSIVDIVGALCAVRLLGIDEITASPVHTGRGFVRTMHGLLPVPAPATAELLRNVPVYAGEVEGELVTPTGALLLTHFSHGFGALPRGAWERIGYGAGSRDLPIPNLLRVFIGEAEPVPAGVDEVMVLETSIDDLSPELFGYAAERLLAAGALDVFTAPLVMKKSRPGVLLTVIARPADADLLCDIVFAETTTAGIRITRQERRILDRAFMSVETRFGEIRVKVFRRGDEVLTVAPEYEECRRAAAAHGVACREVYDEAKSGARGALARGRNE